MVNLIVICCYVIRLANSIMLNDGESGKQNRNIQENSDPFKHIQTIPCPCRRQTQLRTHTYKYWKHSIRWCPLSTGLQRYPHPIACSDLGSPQSLSKPTGASMTKAMHGTGCSHSEAYIYVAICGCSLSNWLGSTLDINLLGCAVPSPKTIHRNCSDLKAIILSNWEKKKTNCIQFIRFWGLPHQNPIWFFILLPPGLNSSDV